MQPYDPYQQQQQQQWQQQPQQQQWQQQQYQQQPKRSAIPKVVGILMIIFGGLGLLGGLWSLVMTSALSGFSDFGRHSEGFDAVSRFTTFSKFSTFLGLGIAVTELMAGIALVGYKAKGIKLAFAYAIANMAISLLSAIIVFAFLQPAMSHAGFGGLVGMGMILGTVLSLAWPIVVLSLITRPAAKASCTNF